MFISAMILLFAAVLVAGLDFLLQIIRKEPKAIRVGPSTSAEAGWENEGGHVLLPRPEPMKFRSPGPRVQAGGDASVPPATSQPTIRR